ncbi:MAG: crossover junction endodeoxyribonuclease RuvC [Planctomycetes bacterium]|nr:crossover junction endodeoxyribonuclease RuvC [Planctomycetota bacterium]
MILALDQATNLSGWCVLNNGGEVVKYGLLNLSKGKVDTPHRIAQVKKFLTTMLAKYDIKVVVIEGVFNAKGHAGTVLMQLYGVLTNTCLEKGVEMVTFMPSSWRSKLSIKGRKREEQKANALKFVEALGLSTEQEDAAEAVCIGKAYWKSR